MKATLTSASTTAHIHTREDEHFAKGTFTQVSDAEALLGTADEYSDVSGNGVYELKSQDGSTAPLYDIRKDADATRHIYHLKLRPEGI